MVIGASTEEPVIFALAIFDRQVVDAGDPPSHQTLFVELPILVANRIAVRFADEWHDDSGIWFRSYGAPRSTPDDHPSLSNLDF